MPGYPAIAQGCTALHKILVYPCSSPVVLLHPPVFLFHGFYCYVTKAFFYSCSVIAEADPKHPRTRPEEKRILFERLKGLKRFKWFKRFGWFKRLGYVNVALLNSSTSSTSSTSSSSSTSSTSSIFPLPILNYKNFF